MERLSIGVAAKILGRTTKQLQRWDNDRVLVAHKTSGGVRYYDKKDILEMKTKLLGLTRKDVSVILGVSEKTLWRWDKSGELSSSYNIGNTTYYTQESIAKYITAKETAR